MLFAVLIANYVIQDGESNWFEGVQLLGVYADLRARLLLRLRLPSGLCAFVLALRPLRPLTALLLRVRVATVGDQRGDDPDREKRAR